MFPGTGIYRRRVVVIACLLMVMISFTMLINSKAEIFRARIGPGAKSLLHPELKQELLVKERRLVDPEPFREREQLGPVAAPAQQKNHQSRGYQSRSEAVIQSSRIEDRDRLVSKAQSIDEQPILHGNRELNLTNIMFFWTDGPKLKVVTLLVLNQDNERVGILTIPLRANLRYGDFRGTLGDYYYRYSQARFRKMIERKLESEIVHFVSVDQDTFQEFSDCLGPIEVKEEKIAFSAACEQTSQGLRRDDQDVIRAFTQKLTEPRMWWKLPKLMWILTSQVDTDLAGTDMLDLYEQTKEMQIHQLIKRPLPVVNTEKRGKEQKAVALKEVEDNTWCNVLDWITRNKVQAR